MKIKKTLWALAGFTSFGIGTIGIFLPILPTTPLYLLAAYCFTRSSERLENWFKSTKLYEKHLHEFVTNRAMPLKQKLIIAIPVTGLLLLTAILIHKPIMYIVMLVIIAIKWTYFFTRIKTIRKG